MRILGESEWAEPGLDKKRRLDEMERDCVESRICTRVGRWKPFAPCPRGSACPCVLAELFAQRQKVICFVKIDKSGPATTVFVRCMLWAAVVPSVVGFAEIAGFFVVGPRSFAICTDRRTRHTKA